MDNGQLFLNQIFNSLYQLAGKINTFSDILLLHVKKAVVITLFSQCLKIIIKFPKI